MKTLLNQLTRAGYKITVKSDELLLTYTGEGQPDADQVQPLIDELKEKKAEAIEFIKRRRQPQKKTAPADPIYLVETTAENIKQQLDENGLALLHSKTLNDLVIIAADAAAARKAPPNATVYTMQELKTIIDGSPTKEDLRQLHQEKKRFKGTFVNGELMQQNL